MMKNYVGNVKKDSFFSFIIAIHSRFEFSSNNLVFEWFFVSFFWLTFLYYTSISSFSYFRFFSSIIYRWKCVVVVLFNYSKHWAATLKQLIYSRIWMICMVSIAIGLNPLLTTYDEIMKYKWRRSFKRKNLSTFKSIEYNK